jgi:hypothetical protein
MPANNQGTIREHSGNNRGTFREQSGHIQGTIGEQLENLLPSCRFFRLANKLVSAVTASGDLERAMVAVFRLFTQLSPLRTFRKSREQSGNDQSIQRKIREHSEQLQNNQGTEKETLEGGLWCLSPRWAAGRNQSPTTMGTMREQ